MSQQTTELQERIAAHALEELAEELPHVMTLRQCAEVSGLPLGTLKYFRHRGHGGPRSFALSPRNIRVTREDFMSWLIDRIEEGQAAA